jgi:hypothetical protein
MPQSTTRIEDPRHFLDLAFGYYMTGRFALLNGLYVGPNLMHHAVELLIKYTLLKDVPEAERSTQTEQIKQTYKHDLNRLWDQYKQHVALTDLSRFDQVIPDLDRWEKVRYGGFPTAGIGVAKAIGPVRAPAPTSRPTDLYVLGWDELDELVTAMFAASEINPKFAGTGYSHTDLREWYQRENKHIMDDLFG